MRQLKISVGVWYLGATSDRFVKGGYRADRTMEERFKLAASVPGVGGLEMHYPTEVTDANYRSLKTLADDLGMKIVQFCPHLWVDPRWKLGQFTNPDPDLRRQAIDLAKRTMDLAGEMQAETMVYWPAQDGYAIHSRSIIAGRSMTWLPVWQNGRTTTRGRKSSSSTRRGNRGHIFCCQPSDTA